MSQKGDKNETNSEMTWPFGRKHTQDTRPKRCEWFKLPRKSVLVSDWWNMMFWILSKELIEGFFFKISRLEGDSKRIKMDTFSTHLGVLIIRYPFAATFCWPFKKSVLEDPNWGLFALVVLAIVSLQAVPNLHYGIRCGLVEVLVFCRADVWVWPFWSSSWFLLSKFCWSTSASILEGFLISNGILILKKDTVIWMVKWQFPVKIRKMMRKKDVCLLM